MSEAAREVWRGGRPAQGSVAAGLLDRFRGEVLRWNSQINLISRRSPEVRLEGLIQQSVEALLALPAALGSISPPAAGAIGGSAYGSSPFRRMYYIDIGSGAGVPGLVWHILLCCAGREVDEGAGTQLADEVPGKRGDGGLIPHSRLVESRGKRAWFLERCIRQLGLSAAQAVNATWGVSGSFLSCGPAGPDVATPMPEPAPTLWLVSLQALRLNDPELLAGWKLATGRGRLAEGDALVVARPRAQNVDRPDRETLDELRRELRLPGEERCRLVQCGRKGGAAALLLSYYEGPHSS